MATAVTNQRTFVPSSTPPEPQQVSSSPSPEMCQRRSTQPPRSGSKRSRTATSNNHASVTIAAPPKPTRPSNAMDHPVREINRISRTIADGDYDGAIRTLTKTLRNLKLVLSGDAKISMPLPPQQQQHQLDRDNEDASGTCRSECHPEGTEKSSGSTNTNTNTTATPPPAPFEYDFFYEASPTAEDSFLRATTPLTTNTSDDNHACVVFTNPLIVRGNSYGAPLDATLCEELSCLAIYNLALSHQLKALAMLTSAAPQATAKAYLSKALSLYEYSHQIFKNQSIRVRVPTLHCMALVSNLGQIHRLLGEPTKARQCHEYLLSILMYSIEERKKERQHEEQQPQQTLEENPNPEQDHRRRCHQLVEGFLAIVQHLIISEDCTAPAA